MGKPRTKFTPTAISQKVRALREKAGLNYPELGRLAGISTEGVRKIEIGKSEPSLKSLRGLALAFKTTVAALIDTEATR